MKTAIDSLPDSVMITESKQGVWQMQYNFHVADYIENRLNKYEAARYLLFCLIMGVDYL